jgi:hypothetical protein
MTGVYISHGRIPAALQVACFETLRASGLERIVAVVPPDSPLHLIDLSPVPVYLVEMECEKPGGRDHWTRIIAGLSHIEPTDPVALLEHDVMYPPAYAKQDRAIMPGTVSYAHAVRLCRDGWAMAAELSSTAVCFAGDLDTIAGMRLAAKIRGARVKWDEPGKNPGDPCGRILEGCPMPGRDPWVPVVDVRHGNNFTGDRAPTHFGRMPHWGTAAHQWALLGGYKTMNAENE